MVTCVLCVLVRHLMAGGACARPLWMKTGKNIPPFCLLVPRKAPNHSTFTRAHHVAHKARRWPGELSLGDGARVSWRAWIDDQLVDPRPHPNKRRVLRLQPLPAMSAPISARTLRP